MEEETNFFGWNKYKLFSLLFFVFLALIVITRVLIIQQVNLTWVDTDQPFMWAGTKDYAEGKFHEPRFYGQDYNTFVEGLFAVPLVWLKVPIYLALPLATHFLFLFPFLFTAFYLFFKKRKANALLVLAIPLCMPVAYDIMNSIPRGFVPGLFFTSFYVLSILDPYKRKFIVLNTLMALTGFFVNPNSAIVSIPFLFYIFLHNFKDKTYYLLSIACLLWVVPLYFIFDYFYKVHPTYVILGLHLDVTTRFFFEALSHLDLHFAHINFFREENSTNLLIVLLLMSLALFRHNKKAFYAFLIFLAFVILSFFTGKTMDGTLWAYYSFSRMFLGIPVFIALAVAFLPLRSKWLVTAVVALTLGYSVLKFMGFKEAVHNHTANEKRWAMIHLVKLDAVMEIIEFYGQVCHKQQVDKLIVSNPYWVCTFINYGGPVFIKNYPSTEETFCERRYWVREPNKDKVYERFVYLSVHRDLDKLADGKFGFNIRRLDDYGLFLVEHNTLKNKDFMALTRVLEQK